MAIKNLQTVAMCVANIHGVRANGTDSKESMRFAGNLQARLSLPRLSLAGSYPIPTRPDAELRADNAAAAQAVERTGRSVSEAGVLPSTWTVLSKRSTSLYWAKQVRG